MDRKTLWSKLNQTPLPIREHLGSETTVDVIGKINESLGIAEEDEKRQRIIPRLLLRLEIKDIEPNKLTGELAAELNLEKNKALSLSHEILRLILLPIKEDLRRYGVDINLLEKFEPASIKFIEHAPPAVLKDEDIEKVAQTSAVFSDPSPAVKGEIDSDSVVNLKSAAAAGVKEEAPMILHKEESEIKTLSSEKTGGMGGLFGFFKRKPEHISETSQVAAKVQFSFNPPEGNKSKEPEVAKTAEPKIKVIHYSEFSPPATDVFGGGVNVEKIKEEQKSEASPVVSVRQEQKEIKKIDFEPKIISPEPPKEVKASPSISKSEKPGFTSPAPSQPAFGGLKIPQTPIIRQEKEIGEIKISPKTVDFSPVPPSSPKPVSKPAEQSFPPKPEPSSARPEHEIKLEDVPVGEDIVDLRSIERMKKEGNGDVNLK